MYVWQFKVFGEKIWKIFFKDLKSKTGRTYTKLQKSSRLKRFHVKNWKRYAVLTDQLVHLYAFIKFNVTRFALYWQFYLVQV